MKMYIRVSQNSHFYPDQCPLLTNWPPYPTLYSCRIATNFSKFSRMMSLPKSSSRQKRSLICEKMQILGRPNVHDKSAVSYLVLLSWILAKIKGYRSKGPAALMEFYLCILHCYGLVASNCKLCLLYTTISTFNFQVFYYIDWRWCKK